MEKRRMIEKIAAGLRRMSNHPDFLLCLDDDFDDESLCGIPLVFTSSLDVALSAQSSMSEDCPFIPIWIKRGSYLMDVHYFFKGYDEY
jgi:hypothetical protein